MSIKSKRTRIDLEPPETSKVQSKPNIKTEEPTVKPIEAFPEPPDFVGWTYDAQQIETFRTSYNEFKYKYRQCLGK